MIIIIPLHTRKARALVYRLHPSISIKNIPKQIKSIQVPAHPFNINRFVINLILNALIEVSSLFLQRKHLRTGKKTTFHQTKWQTKTHFDVENPNFGHVPPFLIESDKLNAIQSFLSPFI